MADVGMHDGERGILVGASGTGKSTLAEHVLRQFRDEHPTARIMVCDTKPRWRAEHLADGTGTRRYYRQMSKGDTIRGSVALTRVRDWGIVWDKDLNPSQTVVVQNLQLPDRVNVLFQTAAAEKFFKTQAASRPSMIYFDEGHDFFGSNASARGTSDIVQRCFRAGREKGLATLIGVQRPKGVNLQCLTETSWCAVFRINFTDDIRRLWEMGWPKDAMPPTYDQPHAFRLWRDTAPGAPLYRLKKGSD